MKKNYTRIISNVFSIFIAISGILSLFIDGIFKPFLANYPEVKLIIIFISVLSAYHIFLSFVIKNLIKEEQNIINNNILCLNSKIEVFNNLIPFSQLDEIERQHGRDNRNTAGKCEIWIIANLLQEARNNDNDLIEAIYDNITKYRVHYYYILPATEKSKREIESLDLRLKEIHKKKKRRCIHGGVSYKFDNRYFDSIISDYFDIVLYIDCYENGKPCLHGQHTTCEGYQCYSNLSNDNKYFYQKIQDDKIFAIRASHDVKDFCDLNI